MPESTALLPPAFLARLPRLVSTDQLDAVTRAFTRRPTTFRVNPLKTTRDAVLAELSARDFQVDAVPWYADAFILRNKTKRELIDTPLYARGEIYVQSLSSMLPPLILDPQPGERVCDLTAAPGGKTTQIAALMHNTGEIVANDRSKIRLSKLVANLKLQGIANVRTRLSNGEDLWKKFPEYFDRVLVDAPCSLEGRFEAGNPKSFGDWSLRKVEFLSAIQSHLLRSAVTMTQPGGIIVYSTCTLSPEENERVLDWLLKKEPDLVQVEPIDFPLENILPGITSWEGKEFSPQARNAIRILPSELMEGFFVAKLRKQ
ncbi:MAG: RsmB/NOP family class I SAM-dependent RNA methyltransferase [Chloroflexi bacterium]|nr:RsmB/NOP family class I SAM-dependent RNA methyltransferase [Chloroflexota bacterium]